MQQCLVELPRVIPKTIREYLMFRIKMFSELSNYPALELKRKHGRMGKRALKVLAQELGLKKYNVNYNPSVIIDAGHVSLIGLVEEGQGIYIAISSGNITFVPNILFRSVKHLKDWTGGNNKFISEKQILNNYESAFQKFKNVI